jgi:hypothetical protein
MLTTRRNLAAASVLAWSILWSTAALAEAYGPDAKAAAAEGRRAFDTGLFVEAQLAFQRAYALSSNPNQLRNAAIAAERAGALDQAVELFEKFLDEAGVASPAAAGVQANVDVIKKRVAAWPRLTVNSLPGGASVHIDAKGESPRATTPATLPIAPGPHKLIVEKAGHASEVLDILFVENAPQTVTVTLKASLGDGDAILRITPPGAVVTVDGARLGVAPFSAPVKMSEGTHWVMVSAPDRKPWTGSLVISRERVSEFVVDLLSMRETPASEPIRWRTTSYYVGAGAAGLILGGLAFGLVAEDLHDDLANQRRDGKRVSGDDADRGDAYLVTETVLLAAGGAALAAAGVFWALGDPPHNPEIEGGIESARIAPAVGVGFIGAVGRF